MNFRKSTYSGQSGGNCLEIGSAGSGVLIRDTKQAGHGPTLRFTPDAWRRLVDQVKNDVRLTPDVVL